MDNTIGLMEAFIKEISSTESDMDMEYGKIKIRFIRGAIDQIKNKVLVSTNGQESKHIKDNSKRIFDKDMDNFTMYQNKILKNYHIKDVGKKGKKMKKQRQTKKK